MTEKSLQPDLRACGTCAACCVWLGIAELNKYMGQTCKHLSGAKPEARCQVYKDRPKACQTYSCFWRMGHFGEGLRPDRCGFLITTYHEGTSIVVFDEARAGAWNAKDSLLGGVIQALAQPELRDDQQMGGAFQEIRIAFVQQRKAVVLRDGVIGIGALLRNDRGDFEGLKFEARPCGTYRVQELGAEAP